MSSLKFYTDTHIDRQVAVQLRQRGVEVIRCEEVGMAEATDAAHLEYVAQNGFALITKDADFREHHFRWLAERKEHHGIFFCANRQHAAIGIIVNACYVYYQLIAEGAGTVEDIKNEFFEIM